MKYQTRFASDRVSSDKRKNVISKMKKTLKFLRTKAYKII